jgi:hypothetical protein
MSTDKKTDFVENTESENEDVKPAWRYSTDSEGDEDDGFLSILVNTLADMHKNNELPLGAADLGRMRDKAIAEKKKP